MLKNLFGIKKAQTAQIQLAAVEPAAPPAPAVARTTPGAPAISLLFPIGHFYSPIADPVDIKAREAKLWARHDQMPGIELNDAEQLELLKQLKPYTAAISYPVQKPDNETTYFYENDQYPVLDAQFLYAALCHYKPKKVFEVGSGFSSLITADVNRRVLNNAIDFRCLEPYPRQFLIDGVDGITELVKTKIEDMDLTYFDVLEENDILFIDSTHVSKVGSDVNYLFFEVIPRLKKGVIVHIHDIFLPDEYPKNWVIEQGRNWNEQYLLRAFLQFNSKWKITWAASYMGSRHLNAVQDIFPDYPRLGGGGSLWMQRI
jgi:Methyltransferase domain